jgi:beta-phosphoglucomutase-like phosphatase (HAD superfamily)
MSEPARRKLLIYDCDGVLVDSEILACGVASRALAAHGLSISPQEVARRFLGASSKDMRAALEIDLGRPLPADFEESRSTELFALFREELREVDGIGRVVAAAGAAGYAQCVASSSGLERIRLALGLVGLLQAFDGGIFSSSMVARGKPAPDLFLYAAGRMGFSPADCLVIEDSVNGVRAARAAGMRVIGFCGGSHCAPEHDALLRQAGADGMAPDAEDLLRHLGLAATAAALPPA